jgi:hypothetical protein
MPIKSGYDLLLLLLYAKPDRRERKVAGTTRLMKELFLLSRRGEFRGVASRDLPFAAYDYGPFSPKVPEAVDLLSSHGLIEVEEKRISHSGAVAEVADDVVAEVESSSEPTVPRRVLPIYDLTAKGERVAEALWNRLNEQEREAILRVKREYNALPLETLLKRVYQEYPDMTKKSAILWELGLGLGSAPELEPAENEE